MNRDPSSIVGRVVATGVFLAGLGIMAMRGNDNEGPKTVVPTAGTAAPFAESASSILVPEVAHNPFLPTEEVLADFDCLNPENEKYGIKILADDQGTLYVKQELPGQIPIAFGAKSPNRREDGNSLDAPSDDALVDLSDPADNPVFLAQISARLCGRVGDLAALTHVLVNSPTYKALVGEDESPISAFRDMTPDQVSEALTIPYSDKNAVLTPEQEAENMAVTKMREGLAEYDVAVLSSTGMIGNLTGLELHSDYALDPESNFRPDEPPTYLPSDIVGDAFFFNLSVLAGEKGKDNNVCTESGNVIGFDTGTTTNGLDDDGDLRIETIISGGNDCTPPTEETTTTIPGAETTTTFGSSTTVHTETTLHPKVQETPTGATVANTIEPSNTGPAYPATSNATTTTSAGETTTTSSTVYHGPTNSQPQGSYVPTTLRTY